MNDPAPTYFPVTMEALVRAAQRIIDWLNLAAAALEKAGLPYAVAGSNASAMWIESHFPAGVRNAREVEILIRREDFECAGDAIVAAGFVRTEKNGKVVFLEDRDPKPRCGIWFHFALEKSRTQAFEPMPDVTSCERLDGKQVLTLAALVRSALADHRLDYKVDVRDLIDVGLVDQSWCARLPEELAARLQHLLDTPDG
jgi:hypothetical protein